MNALRNGLPSKQTTPLNRMIALTIGITTAPGVIVGTSLAIFGMFVPPLIPIMLLLYIPGLKLYIDAWRIYLDKRPTERAEMTWRWTIVYNKVLMAGAIISAFAIDDFTFILGALPGQMAVALLAFIALRDLKGSADILYTERSDESAEESLGEEFRATVMA